MPVHITYEMPNELKPYVQAMMTASGLKEFDAITSVLFAVVTHIDLEQYPILLYLGPMATGKSAAMSQLFPMCKNSKWIGGTTFATQRDALAEVRTAFIDEADRIDTSPQLIDLYTRRYSLQQPPMDVNVGGRFGFQREALNIFGATVMAKRTPIGDVALRSRAIIIRTIPRESSSWEVTNIRSASEIVTTTLAAHVRELVSAWSGASRVHQTWGAITSVAYFLEMNDWLEDADNAVEAEERSLRGGQGYEPSEAILRALDILARDDLNHNRIDKSVNVSDIVPMLRNEFAIALRNNQIEEEARAKGFEVGTLHGYRVVKVKKDLLDALIPESE